MSLSFEEQLHVKDSGDRQAASWLLDGAPLASSSVGNTFDVAGTAAVADAAFEYVCTT